MIGGGIATGTPMQPTNTSRTCQDREEERGHRFMLSIFLIFGKWAHGKIITFVFLHVFFGGS